MKLRADDDIYRARLVYLGPPGYTFPWHFTYGQYVLAFMLTFAGTALFTLVTKDVTMGVSVAIGFASVATAWISKQANFDMPITKVVKVMVVDWRSFQTPPAARQRSRTAGHIHFTNAGRGNRR